MASYSISHISSDKLKQEIQRFFSSNGIRTISASRNTIEFEVGSLWAITPSNYRVSGKLRFQLLGEIVTCSIIFRRSKVWFINFILGFFVVFMASFLLGLSGSNLSFGLDIFPLWLVLLITFFINYTVFAYSFYVLEKSEEQFIEKFEQWFENQLE